MKKRIGVFVSVAMLLALLCIGLPLTSKAASEDGGADQISVTDPEFGADGTDILDDTTAFQNALNMAQNNPYGIEITVPKGTYYISNSLLVYSNTKIIATDATIILKKVDRDSIMLACSHMNGSRPCIETENCTHGGYTQIENVTIEGGTWNAGANNTEYTTLIFQFRHGRNITIRNTVCMNATNHFINLSGIDTAEVDHVTLSTKRKYTGQSPDFWGDFKVGDEERFRTLEAVHIDYLDPVSEGRAYPLDGTPSKNITVHDCTFQDVFAGVGTHHYSKQNQVMENITVCNNTFSELFGYCINAYGYTNMSVYGNTCTSGTAFVHSMKSTVNVSDNTSDTSTQAGIYIGDESSATVKGNKLDHNPTGIVVKEDSFAILENNEIYNSTDTGINLQTCTAEARNNTISTFGKQGISINNNTADILTVGNKISSQKGGGIASWDNKNLYIQDNTVDTPELHGINSTRDGEVLISGNTVTEAGQFAIVASDDAKVTVSDNTIDSPGTHGVYIKGIPEAEAKNNSVVNAGGSGIFFENSATVTAESNTIDSATTHGIFVKGARKIQLTDNKITSSSANGLHVESSANSTLKNNTVEKTAKVGIMVNICEGTVLDSNTVSNTTDKSGIIFMNSSSNTAKSNTITNTKENGILINECADATIQSNKISNTGKASILNLSTDGALIEKNTVQTSKAEGILVKTSSGVKVNGNTVENCPGNGILIVGEANMPCNASLDGNKSVSDAASDYDILLANYSKDCSVTNNVVGKRGFMATPSATYTEKNTTVYTEITTGLYNLDGKWKYYENGQFAAKTGMVKRPDNGKWYYVEKGVLNKATGVTPKVSGSGLYYVKNGVLTKSTGLAKRLDNGKWTYVVNGSFKNLTGAAPRLDNGAFLYVRNGYYDKTFTGEAKGIADKNSYYMVKGQKKAVTGLYKTGGTWKYYENGILSAKTGIVKRPSDNKWFYVEKGVLKKSTGMAKRLTDNKWLYVENGAFKSVTGMVKRIDNGKWYYVEKGILKKVTGAVQRVSDKKWFYVENGTLKKATGLAARVDNGAFLYFKNGAFDATFSGTAVKIGAGPTKYKVSKGKLVK